MSPSKHIQLFAKMPYNSSKETYNSAKMPYESAKTPYNLAKSPTIPQKSPLNELYNSNLKDEDRILSDRIQWCHWILSDLIQWCHCSNWHSHGYVWVIMFGWFYRTSYNDVPNIAAAEQRFNTHAASHKRAILHKRALKFRKRALQFRLGKWCSSKVTAADQLFSVIERDFIHIIGRSKRVVHHPCVLFCFVCPPHVDGCFVGYFVVPFHR